MTTKGGGSFGRSFWIRLALILLLLFLGLWQANQVNRSIFEARRQALGLTDNNGRKAWVRFNYPFPAADSKPFPVILVYRPHYPRYVAFAEKENTGIFTYMGGS